MGDAVVKCGPQVYVSQALAQRYSLRITAAAIILDHQAFTACRLGAHARLFWTTSLKKRNVYAATDKSSRCEMREIHMGESFTLAGPPDRKSPRSSSEARFLKRGGGDR